MIFSNIFPFLLTYIDFDTILIYRYELNIANAVLFDNLRLTGLEELLPGRLFSTRMPRNIKAEPESESAKTFRNNAKAYNLHTVLVLTEANEFQKYAGADLLEFYATLKLEVIHRPIVDFSIPEQRDMIRDIQDLTWRLAEGKSCLIHCAGGSGRTGMVIAGIIKNVGVKDPVAWVRRIKTQYCETPDQEAFVNSLPAVLDSRLSQRHPMLAKAIVAEHILDTVISGKVTLSGKFTHSREQDKNFGEAFDLIDTDKSGEISMSELLALFNTLGAEVPEDMVRAFFARENNGVITRDEFVEVMLASGSSH